MAGYSGKLGIYFKLNSINTISTISQNDYDVKQISSHEHGRVCGERGWQFERAWQGESVLQLNQTDSLLEMADNEGEKKYSPPRETTKSEWRNQYTI
jgi:hypothetical protein